ncbi:MAG: response regulator [Alcanivoracaceae bacterium]|jgi:twitching motility two-component system response regulator PilH|nr:response regulator [Alcanivoracaceae bacterium]
MAKVLVIEDSATERHGIKEALESAGHTVIECDNGEDGVARSKEEQPDLILMDIVMPGMNGFQATRAITRDDATKDIPVIIVTTKSQETDRLWGERQGAIDYLTKPVKADDLLAVVSKHLPG